MFRLGMRNMEGNMRLVVIAALRGCVWMLIGVASAFAIPRTDTQEVAGISDFTADQSIGSNDSAPIGKRDVPLSVIPQSKLLHFDSAIRIPHRYLVKFKDDAALANDIVGSNLSAMKIAPNILPNSAENIKHLANSISTAYQQKEGTAN